METYYFGDVYGSALLFWFLTLIGLALGVVFYAGCAYPHLRRAPLNHGRPFRAFGVAIGSAVCLMIVSLAWGTTWSEFYRLDITEGEVRLQYHLPEREHTIPLSEIHKVSKGITMDKFRCCQLVIERKDGGKYHSANVKPRDFEPRFRAIWKSIR